MCKRFCEKDYIRCILKFPEKKKLHGKCWFYVKQLVTVLHFILSFTETVWDGILRYSVK